MEKRLAITIALLLLGAAFMTVAGGSSSASNTALIPDDVKNEIIRRVDQGMEVGISLGVVSASGVEFFSRGWMTTEKKREVNENTLYDIGSMTKPFTGLLLAILEQNGTVTADDPIGKYLPEGMKTPDFKGEPIRLAHLATHSSGLPSLPSNFAPAEPENPYADYTVEMMYQYLSTVELKRKPGSQYEYSNFGMGLLGHILSLKLGLSYEDAVRKFILDPLGMRTTCIALNAERKELLATPYQTGMEQMRWDIPTLAGAGGLRSSTAEIVRLLAAYLGFADGISPQAMLKSTEPVLRLPNGNMKIGYAWNVSTDLKYRVIQKNGATSGYFGVMAFVRELGLGVVLLTNSIDGLDDGLQNVALHILNDVYSLGLL